MRVVTLKAGWRLAHGDYCPNHTDEAPCADITEACTVIRDILLERRRQDAQWGEQNHPDGTGEPDGMQAARPARSACQQAATTDELTWLHILQEKVSEAAAETNPDRLRAELIQVAAVAAAWVEAIDRRAQHTDSRAAS